MSTLTTFIQLSFGSPIQIHQAIKRKSRHPNLKGRGKTDTICRLKSESVSHSVVSDSLRLHELQHARPPCPSPTPGVHSDSRSSSQWCRISFIIFRKFMSPWQCHHWLIYWLKHYWLIQKFRFLSSLEKLKNPPKYWFYFTARQTLVALMFGTQSAVPINTDLWCLPAERLHVSWNVSLGLHCYSFL